MLKSDLLIEVCKEEEIKETISNENYNVTKIILDENNCKKYNKNPGIYYTIETKAFKYLDHDMEDKVTNILKDTLEEVLSFLDINFKDEIFIVGLGNNDITPDSLGPMVVDKILVTKHLEKMNCLNENLGVVSALSPGVMGQTGIETSDIIKSIVKNEKPKCLIVIDALASRSLKRVGASIQISTGGISPGSGVRNKRKEISKKTIGIPVIAIGVPTVVDVKNIGNDIFEALSINNVDNKEYPEELDFMLTPKEIDKYIIDLSECISEGLNNAIHNLV